MERGGRQHKPFPDVFVIRLDVWEEMIDHCTEQLPNEACGLLSGRAAYATTIWKMKNIAPSPNSFRMDEGQLSHVFAEIQRYGQQLVGIYHSHPTAPPFPSLLDILLTSYEDIPHIIVSMAAGVPTAGCFFIHGHIPHPVPIVIES